MIQIQNLWKSYRDPDGKSTFWVLRGVNLQVQKGAFVAVMGESGAGKSTLMNIIGALDAPDSGSYRLDGQEVGSLPRRQLAKLRSQSIGFIFQNSSLIPSLTAFENVELPLSYRRMPKARRKALAAEALARVGLTDRMQHLPGQLSGGQRQRTAIARAIAASPELILADEPTGSLDQRSGSEVMQQLSALHQSGKTILLITHDPKVAAYADRTVYLRDGKLTAEKDSL